MVLVLPRALVPATGKLLHQTSLPLDGDVRHGHGGYPGLWRKSRAGHILSILCPRIFRLGDVLTGVRHLTSLTVAFVSWTPPVSVSIDLKAYVTFCSWRSASLPWQVAGMILSRCERNPQKVHVLARPPDLRSLEGLLRLLSH